VEPPPSTFNRARDYAQVARNLTDAAAGPLTGFGRLIVDRDPLYTAHFRTLLQGAGVQLLRLPSRSPNLNAYAERFVRSIKHECLRHIIPRGERHLRAIVREFVEHYHAERNHQDLGNLIPFPATDSASSVGRIGRRERLGGMLSFYQRNAA
jgi:transposase InsO family protein